RPRPRLASSVVAAILATTICASCTATGAGTAATPATDPAGVQRSGSHATATAATPLDRVVRDVCNKRVVLLGEDSHHSGGGTPAGKATLGSPADHACCLLAR